MSSSLLLAFFSTFWQTGKLLLLLLILLYYILNEKGRKVTDKFNNNLLAFAYVSLYSKLSCQITVEIKSTCHSTVKSRCYRFVDIQALHYMLLHLNAH